MISNSPLLEIEEDFVLFVSALSTVERIQSISGSYSDLLGAGAPNLIEEGRSLADFIFPWDRNQVVEFRKKNLQAGILRFFVPPFRIVDFEGNPVWVSCMTVVKGLEGEDGKIIRDYLFPVQGNLEAESQVEMDKLARSRSEANQYKELFEKSSDAILILENNVFIECNQATIDMLEYDSKSEFLNTKPFELSPEYQSDGMLSADKVQIMNGLAYEKGSHRFEWDHLKSNGEIIPVEVVLTNIPSQRAGDQTLHVVWRDITERKKAEAELFAQNIKLKSLNFELNQFAYIASHDLQEPIRTMISLSGILINQYSADLPEQAQTFLQFISQSSNRMQQLVKGLLDYSRLGKEPEIAQIDFQSVVEAVVLDLHASIHAKGAEVEIGDLPTVPGYAVELRLLIQNLISNGLKFIPEGIKPVIRISAQEESFNWILRVQDNGIGIDQKDQEKIFELFKRLHARNEFEGTGIGLSHCKKIVDLHGGKIWVESELGKGSTFFVALPKKMRI